MYTPGEHALRIHPKKPFCSETHEMRAFTTFAALFEKFPNRINRINQFTYIKTK